MFLAQKAKQVYGVEIVLPAIDDARENALLKKKKLIFEKDFKKSFKKYKDKNRTKKEEKRRKGM